jgi:hypothetical protein
MCTNATLMQPGIRNFVSPGALMVAPVPRDARTTTLCHAQSDGSGAIFSSPYAEQPSEMHYPTRCRRAFRAQIRIVHTQVRAE